MCTSRSDAANSPNSAPRHARASHSRRRKSATVPSQTGSRLAARSARQRSPAIATLKDQPPPAYCALASWVADHQKRAAVRRIDQPLAAKTGPGVGAHRADIVRIGIGHDARNSLSQQGVDELPDEARAMA